MAFTTHGHHIDGTALDYYRDGTMNVSRCGGPGVCPICSEEAARVQKQDGALEETYTQAPPPRTGSMELLYHDDMTLVKVYAVLTEAGVSGSVATDCINEMHNRRILFRESPDV